MTEHCLFCQIVERKISAKLVYEGKEVEAFYDIHPQAPVHILIIPKKHIAGVSEAGKEDQALLGELILVAGEIARKQNIADYRLIFNNGEQAGQSVFHAHLHLLGGRRFNWPPG